VESTLYFVVAEGLTNVAKYAAAQHVLVTIRDGGEEVTVTVQDDGAGGAQVGAGSGLVGLADRLAVVDGELSVASPPGEGTLLSGRVPVPPPAGPPPSAQDPSVDVPAGLAPVAGG
jgi:signal transduction histidine kinase